MPPDNQPPEDPEDHDKNNASPNDDDSSDVNLTVHQGKQNKHIPGTNEYDYLNTNSDSTKSILDKDVDPQELVNKYAGKGEPIGDIPKGQPGSRERIRTNQPIGKYYDDDTKSFVPTNNFTIRYSKSGVHIVPARP